MQGVRWMSAAAILFLLGATGLFAGEPVAGDGAIKGEVIAIRQSEATQNQGSLTEIQVRTREQQEVWLRLGPAEGTAERFQVGDPIRARLNDGGQGAAIPVRDIKNYRTGETLKLRDRDGALRRDRDRDQLHDVSGDRTQGGDLTRDRDQLRDRSSAGVPQNDRTHRSPDRGGRHRRS